MGGEGFSRAEVLPTNELVEEVTRRLDLNESLLERLCSFSKPTQLWFLLWRSGPQRFNDLKRAGFADSSLSLFLRRLMDVGLVDRVGDKYRALAPGWAQTRYKDVK